MQFNYHNGKVSYDTLQYINTLVPPDPDDVYLDQSLLSVNFDSGYLVDLGWYRDLFVIYIIGPDCNWDNWISRAEVKTWKEVQITFQSYLDWCAIAPPLTEMCSCGKHRRGQVSEWCAYCLAAKGLR